MNNSFVLFATAFEQIFEDPASAKNKKLLIKSIDSENASLRKIKMTHFFVLIMAKFQAEVIALRIKLQMSESFIQELRAFGLLLQRLDH